jgi:hypothetical protein
MEIPENKRVIRLCNLHLEGEPVVNFYNGVRSLDDLIPLIPAGIYELTPQDRFFLAMAKRFYDYSCFWNGGTHTEAPEDVKQILINWFSPKKELINVD